MAGEREVPKTAGMVPDEEKHEPRSKGITTARKKKPKELAVITECCTGCAGSPACVEYCPVEDCMYWSPDADHAPFGRIIVDPLLCIGCKLCSWACPYGAREFDDDEGVMKKCTLCIDRIYNENLAPEDRKPACVMVCPVNARHFGDLGNPDSEVSEMVARRAGGDLMPELGYKPVNKYLPPRAARMMPARPAVDATLPPLDPPAAGDRLLRWVDRLLSR